MVNRIRETLRRHLRVSGPEGSQELWKIARRFEEKIFAAASSQTDYRRKIYLKVFTIMETMYQGSQEPANPVVYVVDWSSKKKVQWLLFTNSSNAMECS
ncbi:hypothetical protein Ahy_B08g091945 isoform C [Arachis hypogaea]|uniref:Mediator complex subunit 15 KIX domain-containing protein n=1 Tax=Arachis hypogaea TaxID=3818 RepID=A0A444Y2Y5_ARAHY|nr:hypothetical protein Ahy_B08g091945 isoform C [Arachis hypogaea]